MNDLPKLPQEISPDGREIWDWAGKLSEHVCKLDKIRRLNADILKLQRECGSCRHWMTKSCPKEAHDNKLGRSRGPSMSAYICQKFEMDSQHTKLMKQWETELSALQAPPKVDG